MSTKDGYVRRINCKCYKELSQSLRVRVYISFKFVAECSLYFNLRGKLEV